MSSAIRAQQIDAVVQGLIDWMVEHDLRTWQAVTELVRRRQAVQPKTEMIGEVSEQFAYDRQALLNSVGARAQEVVQRYNASGEAERLSRDVQAAVFQAGLVQVGAVGLGAAVVVAATTALADFTGSSPRRWSPLSASSSSRRSDVGRRSNSVREPRNCARG